MKQLIEFGAVRIGTAIQNICTNVDFDVLSLPGGSLIAVVLWLYASASGSLSRARASARPQNHTLRQAGLLRVAVPFSASSLIARALLERCVKLVARHVWD
jgi:hypothetical protein